MKTRTATFGSRNTDFFARSARRYFFILHSSLFLLFLSGCATQARRATGVQQPENVFAYGRKLPGTLQRVAVLPLVCEEPRANLPEGCEALNPILLTELMKARRFEVVSVARDYLRSRMARVNWTGAEALPADFFESLRHEYACDAVLFSELTTYRAYAPLAVGWRFKLVDTRTRQILWASDEVFDAGNQRPVNLVSHFNFSLAGLFGEESDENWAMKNSPRQFGQYAAAQLFATLPAR